jgi:uncharacterized protein (TIGR02757 family)
MNFKEVKEFLDESVEKYNNVSFIEQDPIQIPHLFEQKEDIEIIGFLISTIAWGNRQSIIKNGAKLVEIMEDQPHAFIMNYASQDYANFIHRTFNSIDLDFFFRSLQNIYQNHSGLENIFKSTLTTFERIHFFRTIFLEVEHEKRSEKHLANPVKGSSAKRINMFLRWMIRNDQKGVDFGIWEHHSQSDLYIPLDVHTGNSARFLGLIKRKSNDWKALEELMQHLRSFCPEDPCKYDYALFGLSANKVLTI